MMMDFIQKLFGVLCMMLIVNVSYAELKVKNICTKLFITTEDKYKFEEKAVYYVENERDMDKIPSTYYENKYTSLDRVSVTIKDTLGKTQKHYGNSSLSYSAMTNNLKDDYKRYDLSLSSPVYPVLVTIECRESAKNRTCFLPHFDPVPDYGVPVESGSFEVHVKPDMKIRYHLNGSVLPLYQTDTVPGEVIHHWKYANIPPFTDEALVPEDVYTFPSVEILLERFVYESTKGSYASWYDLGEWTWELMKDRIKLSPQVEEEVKGLCAKANSPQEKVKILYEYMQKRSHYESIQWGIGGHQPMKVSDVHQYGYGDCKALSSYMRSLLEVVGVPSHYMIISTRREHLRPDFPSMSQMNHAMVCVPLAKDTLWLECTSTLFKYDYTPVRTQGHQALVVSPGGSKLLRVSVPKRTQPDRLVQNDIVLDANGNVSGQCTFALSNLAYEKSIQFLHLDDKERQKNYIAKLLAEPHSQIEQYTFSESKAYSAQIDLVAKYQSTEVAYVSSKRIQLPIQNLNLISKLDWDHPVEGRKFPFELHDTQSSQSTLNIQIPAGYVVEAMPGSLNLETKWGTYSLTTEVKNGLISLCEKYELRKGVYPVSEWADFCAFEQTIIKKNGGGIVLRKQ